MGDLLDYTAGLYYFYENADSEATTFQAPLARWADPTNPFLNPSVYEDFSTENHSIAAFGSFEYHFDDRWTGEAGLRLTFDRKDFERNTAPIFTDTAVVPLPFSADDDESWFFASPRLGLSYQVSDDALGYMSLSMAQKAGGFNGRAGNNPDQLDPYDPETVYALELGLKSQWLDRRLQANLAAFLNQYNDMQLTVFTVDPISGTFLSLVENAAESRVLGFEAELRALPATGLDLFASLGITEARYLDFDIVDINNTPPGGPPVFMDISDRDFKNTPKLTFHLGGSYTFPSFFAGSMSVGADYAFRSKVHFGIENNNTTAQGNFALANARIGWQSADGRKEIVLWGKNLADREYKSYALDFTDTIGHTIGYWGAPRTFGIETTFRY
jgi:iron complex outermembrane receptor protein